ncbi:MAG TPA: FKBP-type peptidyl-prolyl cis-trans isomerase [Thermoleophilaceae bacterium]|jgi:peptidylprolyl isomerase
MALSLAACGDSKTKTADIPSGEPSSSASTATITTPTKTEPSKPGRVAHGANEKNLEQKPKIPKPTGDPPTELKKVDIVKGDGPVARKGQSVTVQYVGVAWSTGEEFDASWGKGEPFKFKLGQGMVIPGWDEGVVGMRVGGRRQLQIPSELAYGAQGSPPSIGPNEALVFDVDLLKVK